jgi:DNA-binding MarR family transcriptional regulator
MPTRLKQPSAREYADASALREALRSFERRSDEITSSHGMTSRTYQLLLMIKTGEAGPERAGLPELEERLKLGKSTVTELVLRSEKRGLVQRQLEPDSRGAITIRLTPDGERRLADALTALGDERRRLVGILSKLSTRKAR